MGAQQTKDRTLNAGINARSSTRHKPRNTKEFSHPITNIFTEHNGKSSSFQYFDTREVTTVLTNKTLCSQQSKYDPSQCSIL
ncbi:hypothetical protein M8J76_002834 [Diaphorina citri]|nr:hypothetical protein M8J75_010186 [Diaphorina citri]KAI5729468.1 hypothetical protein M8J76_002834 [Diaphorina citri]